MPQPHGLVERLANWEIVVVALSECGGATRAISTEDIAVRAWHIAPSRFGWKNYPEFPDMDTSRVALTDAQKEKNGSLVRGDKRRGWSLTPAGLTWMVTKRSDVGSLSSSRTPSVVRREDARALENLRAHPLARSGEGFPARFEVADAIGLVADAPLRAVEARLDALENAAALSGQNEMQEIIKWLKQALSAAS